LSDHPFIRLINYLTEKRILIKNNDWQKMLQKNGRTILRMLDLKLNEEVAKIVLNPIGKQILDIIVYEENLRFECRQCATFCCKLGGPNLTKKDLDRIANTGYEAREFFIPFTGRSESSSTFLGSLRSKENGSCIFLRFNQEKENYSCAVYDSRPALCRLYPFDFQKINSESLILRLIPCCRGLSTQNGAPLDEKLIVDLFKVARQML
jgi:Fe-S-cluster containining protein